MWFPGKRLLISITAEPLTNWVSFCFLPSTRTVTLPVASLGKVTSTTPEVLFAGKVIFTWEYLSFDFTSNVVLLDWAAYNSSPRYLTITVYVSVGKSFNFKVLSPSKRFTA